VSPISYHHFVYCDIPTRVLQLFRSSDKVLNHKLDLAYLILTPERPRGPFQPYVLVFSVFERFGAGFRVAKLQQTCQGCRNTSNVAFRFSSRFVKRWL